MGSPEAVRLGRRGFLVLAAGGLAAEVLVAQGLAISPKTPALEAVAFDAFVIFDPSALVTQAELLYPGRGHELAAAWRTRQFEYCWLRSLARRYADFERISEDALIFATKSLHLEPSPEQRRRLMQALFELPAYPDVASALSTLRRGGMRLVLLSNMTAKMLRALLDRNDLRNAFDHILSTDQAATYKPDPRAYRLSVDRLGLAKEQIAFAAFAGWDAAGAKFFGYRTFWVNRLGLPSEDLGIAPDAAGPGMQELVDFVQARRHRTDS